MNNLYIDANLENLNKAMKFVVNTVKEKTEISKKTENEILIICEEIIMNIISYAYNDNNGKINIISEYNEKKRELTIQFSDYGIKFNPLEENPPNINLDIMERKIGGLGIFMVKKMSNEIKYERKNNKNVLTLKKFI